MLLTTMLTHLIHAQDMLTISAGYGSENNVGNNGINASAGYQIYVGKRLFLESELRYFTTSVGNQYHYKKNRSFPGEQRRYNVLFLSENLGYSIGDADAFHINLKTGLSIMYQNYKLFSGYTDTMIFRNNTVEFVRTGVQYDEGKRLEVGINAGVAINIPINRTSFLGVGLDTYSRDIPLQFTQAYLLFKKRLTSKTRKG